MNQGDIKSEAAPMSTVAVAPKKNKFASVVSGAASGALVSACVQPFDVIRTRMQADAAKGQLMSATSTMRLLIRNHGVRAMWQGTQPTVIRLGVGAGLHFFFLETIKPLFLTKTLGDVNNVDGNNSNRNATLGPLGAALTGGLSRAMSALISCPITVVKTRMEYIESGIVAGQTSSATSTISHQSVPRYNNTIDALQTVARTEGVRGLYRGLGPTILSNAPFSALYYLFYTRAQSRFRENFESLPSVAINFSSSTIAAVTATLLTQPADVVRTTMQLNLADAQRLGTGDRSSSELVNTFKIMGNIVRRRGMKGLLAGAAPRMVKRTLQTALVWTLYEELAPLLTHIVSRTTATNQGKIIP